VTTDTPRRNKGSHEEHSGLQELREGFSSKGDSAPIGGTEGARSTQRTRAKLTGGATGTANQDQWAAGGYVSGRDNLKPRGKLTDADKVVYRRLTFFSAKPEFKE